MHEAGVSIGGGPLAVMLSEQGRGRRFTEEMKNPLESHEKGEPVP
jgi:hypothetical protein